MRNLWIFCLLFCFHSAVSDPLHLEWCDNSINPLINFYKYANTNWEKNNPIPPEHSRWNVFSILEETNFERIHQILIEAEKNQNAPKHSAEQIIGDLYASAMDVKTINTQNIQPLQTDFDKINSIRTQQDLQKVITHLQKIGVNVLFDFVNMQDFKDSTKMIGALMQGGLSLPDRDYYLSDKPEFKKIRVKFLKYVQNMFKLIGDDDITATQNAQIILQIETELAQSSLSKIQMRDPYKIYHIYTTTQLQKNYPYFNWSKYLTDMWQKDLVQLNLSAPSFFASLNNSLKNTPLSAWKIYLRWHLIGAFAQYLPDQFVETQFTMSQALSGAKKLHPRWRRFIDNSNLAIEFAMGELYVKQYFPKERKNEVREIMHQIRQALRDDLATLPWMQPKTRIEAVKKLDLMEERIGYPDRWWDYQGLNIDRKSYILNMIRANKFLNKHELTKIGKPVDRGEWAMPPQSVNAYYDPSMNNINIPAGILEPPFFDPNASDAINYGAIGWVIGHEITHGFDDEGSQFDGLGNLHNWWQNSDQITFNRLTQCIVDQFSQYTIGKNIFLKGKLVSGEAIADLGGLKLAYRAFHNAKNFKNAQTIDGKTPAQQFFISAAHLWANNIREEQAITLATVDPHPPSICRVNGTLANIPEFLKAFNGKNTNNHKLCEIW